MTNKVKGILDFFESTFKHVDSPHAIALAVMKNGDSSSFKQLMIPNSKKSQIAEIVLHAEASGFDVYFSSAIYPLNPDGSSPKPKRENAIGAGVLQVDFDDGNAPENWAEAAHEKGIPIPTRVVQSSVKGNQHVYWELDRVYSTEEIEERNRALAFQLGADRSGWDVNQLLRVPYTKNYGFRSKSEMKPWYKGSPVEVVLLGDTGNVNNISKFDPAVKIEKTLYSEMSDRLGPIPTYEEAISFGDTTEAILKVANMTKEEVSETFSGKRSGGLMHLAYLMAEQKIGRGFTDEEMYAILEHADSRWEKYTNRTEHARRKLLLETIVRARTKHGYPVEESLGFLSNMLNNSEEVSTQPTEVQHVFSYGNFREQDWQVNWLIKDRIVERSIGFVAAEPGTGKTQLTLNMAMQMAAGLPFFNWENEVGPIKVLYLSLEMSGPPLKQFYTDKIEQNYLDHLQDIQQNLSIAPLGTTIPLETIEGHMYLDHILGIYKPEMVFIDSLQTALAGDMNDNTSARQFSANIADLRDKHNCGFTIIHHLRKKSSDGKDSGGLSTLYGSTFLTANSDWVMGMTSEDDGKLTLRDYKHRMGIPQRSISIKRNSNLGFELREEKEEEPLTIGTAEALLGKLLGGA